MKYAVLLAVAVGMAAGQSIEWKTAPEQCGWWRDYDVAKNQVGAAHKDGKCSWIVPEPTRYYLAWGLGDDATAQLGPQDLENARPVIKMCSGLTGECEVLTTAPLSYTTFAISDESPLDVPAIQETAPGTEPLVLRDPNNCVDGWMVNAFYGNHCASRKYWTCKDKTNTLLTAEDGTKWCHKIQK